jgi:hypothetical protein
MDGGSVATFEELLAIAYAHARAEGEDDLATTMATLEAEPVYELQPMGLKLVGRELAQQYYEWFFPNFRPLVVGYELRAEWANEHGVAQEYVIDVRGEDGTVERHAVIGILTFGTTALAGERVWGSERILRLMFGPLYDLAVPIDNPS